MRVEVAEEELVEFEPCGELSLDVSDSLQELVEDRTGLFEVMVARKPILHARKKRLRGIRATSCVCGRQEKLLAREVATPIQEFMSEADKVLLYQYLKAPSRPIIGIQAELRYSRQLRCAVPPIGTVDEHV
jgi:hypothetical protein